MQYGGLQGSKTRDDIALANVQVFVNPQRRSTAAFYFEFPYKMNRVELMTIKKIYREKLTATTRK